MILVIAEQRDGTLNRATWETVAAAQQLASGPAGSPDPSIAIVVLGSNTAAMATELAAAAVREVIAVDHAALELYTPDAYTGALEQVVADLSPSLVLLPHTYQTRDFAPKLAARLGRALITDVTRVKTADGEAVFVRQMFQGKLTADVVPQGPAPHLVTFQIGAFRPDQATRGASSAPVRATKVTLDAAAIREKPEPPFREAKQAVDLSQADRIVAVGRGIKGQEHLPVADRKSVV